MDRIAACKIYNGTKYTQRDPVNYLNLAQDSHLMHEHTHKQLHFLLELLAEKGEKELFSYIRKNVLTNEDFMK